MTYDECIDDLLHHHQVHKMAEYKQHRGTSRLRHAIKVSKSTYIFCKLFKLNYIEATRAAFLHDCFNYQRKSLGVGLFYHTVNHPKVSRRKASEILELSELQNNIILSHMFPAGTIKPASKEAWIVNLSDTIIATYELVFSFLTPKTIAKRNKNCKYQARIKSIKSNHLINYSNQNHRFI